MRKLLSLVFLVLSLTSFSKGSTGLYLLGNGKISLGFDRQTGKLVSLVAGEDNREYIDASAVTSLPWKLGSSVIPKTPSKVTFRKQKNNGLLIRWKYPSFEVQVRVRLDKDSPMSYWCASVKGLSSLDADFLSCPAITGLKHYNKEVLLLPTWLGALVYDPVSTATKKKPAVFTATQPHGAAQLTVLYDNDTRKSGLFLSSHDAGANVKKYRYIMDAGHTSFSVENFIPEAGHMDSFEVPFESVVGSFDGDWLDAAFIYKEWATGQAFCREGRLHSGKTPEWLRQTAFWVWNRGRSDNVIKEAEDMQERLGLPVNAYWHWWHDCAYDSGFPEYLPPREGRESFMEAVERAHGKGVRSLVYMNSYQWGDSTESWKTEGAEAYASRRKNGRTYAHVYEKFSGKSLTPMCMATGFWQDKYTSLCDTVLNRYHVDGVYMDQACDNVICYSSNHAHPVCGGSYWVDGFRSLTGKIRERGRNNPSMILAGEGSCEDWMPLLDLFLTLPVSRERYRGVNNWESVPLFQALYHEYAITFGNYSSLVYPPYDEKWVDTYRPANAEKLLPEEYNTQFRMEQARSFVWGMQPTLANFHSFLFDERKSEMDYLVDLVKTRYNALDYLLYGTLKALPDLNPSMQTIPISRVSIYAGRYGSTVTRLEKTVPVLYSALWLSGSGNAALAISNISDRAEEICFVADASKYGLPSGGKVNVITSGGKETLCDYRDGDTVKYTVAPGSSCVIEFEKL